MEYLRLEQPVPLQGGGALVGWRPSDDEPIIRTDTGSEATLTRMEVAWFERGNESVRYGAEDDQAIEQALESLKAAYRKSPAV